MIPLTDSQIDFLDKVVSGEWSINPENGLIDVNGSVNFPYNLIDGSNIPVSFGKVSITFRCAYNNILTLEGCPYWVGGDFMCRRCGLESLKYAPKYIGGNFNVWVNPIREINWTPEHLGGLFVIDLNDSPKDLHGFLISEIQLLLDKGVEIFRSEYCYSSHVEAYYEQKIIEIL